MKTLISIVLLMIILCISGQTYAAWSSDPAVNNAISTAANDQRYPFTASDGNGGAIIIWQDFRSGAGSDIYAQRIDANGDVLWTADGVPISTAANSQYSPTIVSYVNGGAIVTWYDWRSGTNFDIYAQRIDANGNVLWTADGVPISTAANSQERPAIVSDGNGGAIITWYDSRSSNYDIYAQRIDANGNVLWTADGVAISIADGWQSYPTIVSDGSGGAIITWNDGRSGNGDIYAQRIDANGNVLWTTDGVAISTAANSQSSPFIVSDGNGGAIITWYDSRSGNWDIYAQRINASGVVQWTTDGVAISTAANNQYYPFMVSDGSSGAIITWYDYRSGANFDIYAQRINTNGVVQWTADGVPISTAANSQERPTIASDGSGGAIITWYDYRSGNYDIYAQRIDTDGNVLWTADGVSISIAVNSQYAPTIVGDGIGGAIITWEDARSGNFDIYAQRIPARGVLGEDTYTLTVSKSGTGSGTVTSSPSGINCGADCSEVYTNGTVVTLTAASNSNSTFAGWSGDADCADGVITMNSAKNCIATFMEVKVLTIGISQGNGTGTVTITPHGEPIFCAAIYIFCEAYPSGTIVTLTATPSSNSTFAGWSGDADCSDGILFMDASKTCTPTFNLKTYTLTASVSGNGTVTSAPSGISCPGDCSEVYTHGTSVTLTAAPVSGWAFAGWSGACSGTGTCTVAMTVDTSVTATFTQTWFEESDSAITYTGTWSTSSCASCSSGAMKYTSQTGAKANLSFNGTGIQWIATKSKTSGKANVYIDGAYVGAVDLDSRNTQYQVVVFEKTGLAPRNHAITIEFPGKKVTVNIDAFEVIP